MTEIDNGRHRTIEVDTAASASRWTTITLTNTISGDFIVAGLNPAQRKALADALDPGRGTYPSGSHADEMARAIDRLTADREQARRELEWSRKDRDKLDERARKANARADAAEAKVRELEKDRDVWRERAVNGEPRPEVSKADIEKAIRSCVVMHRWSDNAEIVEVPFALDAVCKELGIEAEQAADPVDALAEELYTVVGEGRFSVPSWDNLTDHARENYRRMAKHVIERKEADR